MDTNYIFFTLIFFGNLFIQNFAQVRNDSDVSVVQIEKVSHSHNIHLSYGEINKVGFENKSYYENECDCGPGSQGCKYDSRFTFLKKIICDCKQGYSQKGDTCEQCGCGPASQGCSYDVFGTKTCDCKQGYYQLGDRCEKCDCGFNSIACTILGSLKVCTCKSGYAAQFGKCEKCDCGSNSLGCNFRGPSKECTCKPRYAEYYGTCKVCNCGYNAEKCKFQNIGWYDTKTCICKIGYVEKNGECERCDCGYMATSCDLTFDKYTRCTCKPGYVAERTTWEMNEKCELSGPSGWRIATYVESVVFASIILISTCSICFKKMSS